jgi:hypothetical protein
MSRGGTTLYVTGFGHGTRARDLAYEFERYVQPNVECSMISFESDDPLTRPSSVETSLSTSSFLPPLDIPTLHSDRAVVY